MLTDLVPYPWTLRGSKESFLADAVVLAVAVELLAVLVVLDLVDTVLAADGAMAVVLVAPAEAVVVAPLVLPKS